MLDNSSISLIKSPTQRYFLYDMKNDYYSSYGNSVWGFSASYSFQVPSFGSCFAAGAGFGLGAGLARIGMRLLDKWLGGGEGCGSYFTNYAQNYSLGGGYCGYNPWTSMGWFGTSQMYPQMGYGNYGLYTPAMPLTPSAPSVPEVEPKEKSEPKTKEKEKSNKNENGKDTPSKTGSEEQSTQIVTKRVEVVQTKGEQVKTNKDLDDINKYKAELKLLKSKEDATKEEINQLYRNINEKNNTKNLDGIDDDKDIESLNSLAKKVGKLYAKRFREDIVTGTEKPKKNLRYYKDQVVNFAKRVPEVFTKKDTNKDKEDIKALKARVKDLEPETSANDVKKLYTDIKGYTQKDGVKKNTDNYELGRLLKKVEKFAHNHNIRLVDSTSDSQA